MVRPALLLEDTKLCWRSSWNLGKFHRVTFGKRGVLSQPALVPDVCGAHTDIPATSQNEKCDIRHVRLSKNGCIL